MKSNQLKKKDKRKMLKCFDKGGTRYNFTERWDQNQNTLLFPNKMMWLQLLQDDNNNNSNRLN